MGDEAHVDLSMHMKPEPLTSERSRSSGTTEREKSIDEPPMSPRNFETPFSRAHTTLDMDDYFVSDT